MEPAGYGRRVRAGSANAAINKADGVMIDYVASRLSDADEIASKLAGMR